MRPGERKKVRDCPNPTKSPKTVRYASGKEKEEDIKFFASDALKAKGKEGENEGRDLLGPLPATIGDAGEKKNLQRLLNF